MKKVLTLSIGAIFIAVFSIISIYIWNERSFDELENTVLESNATKNNNNNEAIKVVIVGDSWIAGEKLDSFIQEELKSANIKAEIFSHGYPGYKSREVYRKLITEDLLEDADYLISLVGVNDAAGHIGKDFYAHHVKNIVFTANSHSVFPLVVELPEFEIEQPVNGLASKAKQTVFKYLFDGGKSTVINDYRKELDDLLSESTLEYKTIEFDSVVKNYTGSTELYKDYWHLNEKGNEVLGTHIGKNLVEAINEELVKSVLN